MAASTTRDKLLDAAARLFAERGIHNVSIAEIVRAGDQRNASAVHYHFGSREGVLEALLARHVEGLRARRFELLELAKSRPDDARSAAEAMVRPVVELAQKGWRERAYLQIGAELIDSPERATPAIRALLHNTGGYDALALLASRIRPMGPEEWTERATMGAAFVGRAAADRARMLDKPEAERRRTLSDDAFMNTLIDMFLGAMSA